MVEAAQKKIFSRITDPEDYSVAELIEYVHKEEDEFDEIEKWIVRTCGAVSDNDPSWIEALQVYQYGGDPKYRDVFICLYDRHSTLEEQHMEEVSLPDTLSPEISAISATKGIEAKAENADV